MSFDDDEDEELENLINLVKEEIKAPQKQKERPKQYPPGLTAFQRPEPTERVFADQEPSHVTPKTSVSSSVRQVPKASRGELLLKKLPSMQELIILREIIGPCRGQARGDDQS